MRHADLLREATAGIAKPASAPCMILQCGTWYGCVAVWVCVWWWDERCDRFKNSCKTFWTKFFDGRIQSKKSSFSTGSASRNSQSKKVESKKPFFNSVRKPDLGFSRTRPFSTDKSDCIRNGLSIVSRVRRSTRRRVENSIIIYFRRKLSLRAINSCDTFVVDRQLPPYIFNCTYISYVSVFFFLICT